jgi:hypothetical protein
MSEIKKTKSKRVFSIEDIFTLVSAYDVLKNKVLFKNMKSTTKTRKNRKINYYETSG